MDKITINGKELRTDKLKSLRAMLMFESITKKTFELKTMSDIYLYFYLVLSTSNKDANLEFDEYLDYMEEHPEVLNLLIDTKAKEDKFDEALLTEVEEVDGSKKK